MVLRTRMFATILGTGLGAGVGRFVGGKFSKGIEEIRAAHPDWTDEEVKNEYKRLKARAKSTGTAYGAAIGSKSRTLGGAALGGLIGRNVIKPKEEYIESKMSNNPNLSRREAELMYEKYMDRKEQQGALIGGALGFLGGRAYDNQMNKLTKGGLYKIKNRIKV